MNRRRVDISNNNHYHSQYSKDGLSELMAASSQTHTDFYALPLSARRSAASRLQGLADREYDEKSGYNDPALEHMRS